MSSPAISPVLLPGDLARFQTFWARFIANLLDGMVLIPFMLPATLLIGYGPKAIAIAWVIAVAPAAWLYTSYCHGRWGQTIGKRATKICVVRADTEGAIGYGRALRRDIGSIVFSTLGCVVMVILITRGDVEAFRVIPDFSANASSSAEPREAFGRAFSAYNPASLVLMALNSGWELIEVGTMKLSQKRRALHDCIGGTVVVTVDPQGARTDPFTGPGWGRTVIGESSQSLREWRPRILLQVRVWAAKRSGRCND